MRERDRETKKARPSLSYRQLLPNLSGASLNQHHAVTETENHIQQSSPVTPPLAAVVSIVNREIMWLFMCAQVVKHMSLPIFQWGPGPFHLSFHQVVCGAACSGSPKGIVTFPMLSEVAQLCNLCKLPFPSFLPPHSVPSYAILELTFVQERQKLNK